MDRDVVISLEIMAPTRSRSALQKALAGNINSSTEAVMQKQRGLGAAEVLHGARGNHLQPTAPSRPVQEDEGGREGGYRKRGRRWCAQQSVPVINHRTNSLFGFLNHTTTAVGSRLLRTNLLQPLTDVNTLELRLDSLQVQMQEWGLVHGIEICAGLDSSMPSSAQPQACTAAILHTTAC